MERERYIGDNSRRSRNTTPGVEKAVVHFETSLRYASSIVLHKTYIGVSIFPKAKTLSLLRNITAPALLLVQR